MRRGFEGLKSTVSLSFQARGMEEQVAKKNKEQNVCYISHLNLTDATTTILNPGSQVTRVRHYVPGRRAAVGR